MIKMRGILAFFLVLILISISEAKINIVTTVKPLSDIAKAVGGKNVSSNYIIPPNVSFHIYEYKFSDMKKVSQSDIFLYIGAGEPNIDKLVKIAKGKKIKVGALKGIELVRSFEFGEEHHHEKHHHHEEDFHPAIWLDPVNALIIAVNIKNTLQKLDPKNSNYYEKNYLKFQNEVVKQFNHWFKKYQKLKRRDFISYHYLWIYLTRRYKLNYLAVIELGHGREPSIKHLIRIIELIKKRGIKSIFVAKQFENKKYIDMIKKQTGITVIYLDPFGVNRNYTEMMEYNLEKIYTGLSKE